MVDKRIVRVSIEDMVRFINKHSERYAGVTGVVKYCPRCGEEYNTYPALSRIDNETLICNNCGTDEALQDYFGRKIIV